MGWLKDQRIRQLQADKAFLEKQAEDYKRLYQNACKIAAEAIANIRVAKGIDPPPRQFSREEIDALIRLCHPDKHDGKESAKAMTQKLLSMR